MSTWLARLGDPSKSRVEVWCVGVGKGVAVGAFG